MGNKRDNRCKIVWLWVVIALSILLVEVGLAHPESYADPTELISAGDMEFLSLNYALAYEKYSLASVRDDKAGNYRLAMLLYFGCGVDKDVDKALDLLEKSAKQGYRPAWVVAGILGKYDLDVFSQTLIGMYLNWVKVSLEKGNVDGMFYLALMEDHKAICYEVNGPAMSPTLKDQEVLLVNLSAYDVLHRPQKGDIIVFKYPKDHSKTFIKRVIATEGDDVEMKSGNVYINGEMQEEVYVFDKGRDSYPLYHVPEGAVYVLGDNRRNSEDSRYFGGVPLELIQGKVVFVILPK